MTPEAPAALRERFWELARAARRPVAITGAGVSAESGVPTFRGEDGLWKRYRPEELATPGAFARNPELVWQWYNWRRERIARARPNPAHHWLARYERLKPGFVLVTQNVDGLHRLAGSRNVIEIHGNLWIVRCTKCRFEAEDRRVPMPILPRCPGCGGLVRPGVVWFGEPLPEEGLADAVEAVRRADLLLVLGTSAVVYPVAGLPDLAPDTPLVEVNPEPTPLSPRAALTVRMPVGAFLEPILERLP